MLTLLFYFYGQKINMSMLTLVKCCSIGVWHLRNLLVQWYCCTHSRPLLNCTEFTASWGIQAEIEGYNCAFSDFLKWRLLSAVPFLSIQFCGTPLIHKIGQFKKRTNFSVVTTEWASFKLFPPYWPTVYKINHLLSYEEPGGH